MPFVVSLSFDKLRRSGNKDPLVVSLSNHERPFDGLRVSGNSLFEAITKQKSLDTLRSITAFAAVREDELF